MPQFSQAGQFDNVFSSTEILDIKNALSSLPPRLNAGLTVRSYTNSFTDKDIIYPFIKKRVLNKIQKHLQDELKLYHGMYLREFKPWEIHTDYKKNDTNPGLAVLIPLHVDPINTHTVIFNEECFDMFTLYMTHHDKLENNATDLHNTLMSHQPLEHLEYVSLMMAIPWNPGSVIYWDRKLLHSSDNFIAAGITEKHALVMFFQND
jgi:hypothetical protein